MRMTHAELRTLLDSPLITVSDYARIFGLSLAGAYDAIGRGEVRTVRVGRTIRVLTTPLRAPLGLEEAIAA